MPAPQREYWVVTCDEHVTEARRTQAKAVQDLEVIVDYGACARQHHVIQVDGKNRPIGAYAGWRMPRQEVAV
jgi:hypothetical protein